MKKSRKEFQRGVFVVRAVSWPVLVAAIFAGVPLALGAFDADPDVMTAPVITNPAASEVWLGGSDHVASCSPAVDKDCNRGVTPNVLVDDSVSHYWTGSGEFKDNDFIGTSVTYICTTGPGTDTLTVYANDNFAPEWNTYLADDQETSDTETVSVVIPWIEEINFSGTNNYAMKDDSNPPVTITTEYDKSAGITKPACQLMNARVTLNPVKFRASADLTESTSVKVSSTGSVAFDEHDDTWSTWDSGGISMTSSDDEYGKTPNNVDDMQNFAMGWGYRVPSGSDETINIDVQGAGPGPLYLHVFVVSDTPKAPEAVPVQVILQYACYWASGTASKVSACNAIVGAFADHYNWVGNCYALASDFVRLVASIGVTASENTWSSMNAAYWSESYAIGDMYQQKTRSIDPVGASYGEGQRVWFYHEWAQAEGNQYDPSTAYHCDNASWGDYEDWLYDGSNSAQYQRVTGLSPLTTTWDAGQTGQSSGCEASSHRHYTSAPGTNLQAWKGPDYE